MGSTMSQMSESVGSEQNGSITAVVGSGITSMSLAWIACQPRMDEPSKPKPSSKDDSSSCPIGKEKCCHRPGQSVNLRSTMTTPLRFASSSTCLGFMRIAPFRLVLGLGWIAARAFRPGDAARLHLHRVRAALAGADPDHVFHGEDEDLAIADAPGIGGRDDGLRHLLGHLVRHGHLDLDLGEEVHDVLRAPIELR